MYIFDENAKKKIIDDICFLKYLKYEYFISSNCPSIGVE